MSKYDDELVKYNNWRYPPSKIAEILCVEHNLDPSFMNRKSVERRLRYIKKNHLRTLAPTNVNLDAQDLQPPISKCKIIYKIFEFL